MPLEFSFCLLHWLFTLLLLGFMLFFCSLGQVFHYLNILLALITSITKLINNAGLFLDSGAIFLILGIHCARGSIIVVLKNSQAFWAKLALLTFPMSFIFTRLSRSSPFRRQLWLQYVRLVVMWDLLFLWMLDLIALWSLFLSNLTSYIMSNDLLLGEGQDNLI